MKNINILFVIATSLFFTACKDGDSSFAGGNSNGNSVENNDKKSTSEYSDKIVLNVEGKTISLKSIDKKKSVLQFYTANSDIKQDASLTINADNGDQLIVVIAGLQGKGVDLLSGSTDITKNNSSIVLKNGNTEYRYFNGTLNVEEVAKESGTVKLSVKGKCMKIIDGKITPTTRKGLKEATLQVNTKISNVRTVNFQKP